MPNTAALQHAQHVPTLRVTTEDGDHAVPCAPDCTIHDMLASTNLKVRSACGGTGNCGQCRIRIIEGMVPDPTDSELNWLTPDLIQQGIRLACQVRPRRDVRIAIINPVRPSAWRSLTADEYPPFELPPHHFPDVARPNLPYGAAVDVGTTHIRVSVWDMTTRQRLAGCSGRNPQDTFGADVLTRLAKASESRARAREIAQLARDAVGAALHHLTLENGWPTHAIGRLTIVGNTAMLALLAERNAHRLLRPAYWTRPFDCHPRDSTSWKHSWGLDDKVDIEVIQPLAGFVGSDLLAGALATGLTRETGGTLLIDFGTNSEIALWDGAGLWVTSTAGGPAFEGGGIRCGMPAEPGAIYRVEPNSPSAAMPIAVIGGGPPGGICGSGLVDMIGDLRQAGRLRSNGTFTRNVRNEDVVIVKGPPDIVLTQHDVDLFQRAKAAIGAGIICLLNQAGLRLNDVRRIYICGAFGQVLNVRNAQALGLLPGLAPESIELWGHAALAGAELLLLSQEYADALAALRRNTRLIHLSSVPDYEDLFIKHLFLQPMPMA